jgi:hypothetical protein
VGLLATATSVCCGQWLTLLDLRWQVCCRLDEMTSAQIPTTPSACMRITRSRVESLVFSARLAAPEKMGRPGFILVVITALSLAVLLPAADAYTRPDQGEMLIQVASTHTSARSTSLHLAGTVSELLDEAEIFLQCKPCWRSVTPTSTRDRAGAMALGRHRCSQPALEPANCHPRQLLSSCIHAQQVQRTELCSACRPAKVTAAASCAACICLGRQSTKALCSLAAKA